MAVETADIFRRDIGTTRNFELVDGVRRAAQESPELAIAAAEQAKSEATARIARHLAHVDILNGMVEEFSRIIEDAKQIQGAI